MWNDRFDRYVDRIRRELRRSFAEDYSPREIAGSFATGVFITMLPTWGIGVLMFFLLVRIFDWINKIAIFASVIVFNPVVKWGVYAGSFTLGVLLLGPVEGVTPGQISFSAGPEIVVRLLVGNLILAVVATVPSYFIVHRLVVRYRDTGVGEAIEIVVEEAIDGDGGTTVSDGGTIESDH